MTSLIIQPSPSLRTIVQRYGFYKFEDDPSPDASLFLLPSFDNGFMFHFYSHGPILVKNEGLDYEPLPMASLIPTIAIPTRNFEIRQVWACRVLFQPGILSALYHISFRSIRNTIFELGNGLDKDLYFLQEQLAETESFADQVHAIEAYLLRKLRFFEPNRNLFGLMNNLLIQQGYTQSVEKLAREIGLSSRQLNRLLNEQTGFSATEFIRIHRFNRVLKFFQKMPSFSLTQVAHHFDYYDQSHFIRDFRRMTDQTPGGYLKSIGKYHLLVPASGQEREYTGVVLKG
jgi:AraC-like DNA-binding protein